jgi:hypothetical protein
MFQSKGLIVWAQEKDQTMYTMEALHICGLDAKTTAKELVFHLTVLELVLVSAIEPYHTQAHLHPCLLRHGLHILSQSTREKITNRKVIALFRVWRTWKTLGSMILPEIYANDRGKAHLHLESTTHLY